MAVGAVGASRLVGLGGSGLAVTLSTASVVPIVILSPLVVIGPDLATVRLAFVALGVNRVVRLAPSGVVVDTVSLLGICVVVVATLGGTVLGVGTVMVLGTVGTVVAVAVAVARTRAVAGTVVAVAVAGAVATVFGAVTVLAGLAVG